MWIMYPREAADDLYASQLGVLNIERIRSQRRGVMRVLLSLIMQENT